MLHRRSTMVDQIEFVYNDGQVASHGGTGSTSNSRQEETFVLQPGEKVVRIDAGHTNEAPHPHLPSSSKLAWCQFVLDSGRSSPRYGSDLPALPVGIAPGMLGHSREREGLSAVMFEGSAEKPIVDIERQSRPSCPPITFAILASAPEAPETHSFLHSDKFIELRYKATKIPALSGSGQRLALIQRRTQDLLGRSKVAANSERQKVAPKASPAAGAASGGASGSPATFGGFGFGRQTIQSRPPVSLSSFGGSQWSCAACTLLNGEHLVECSACGGRERAAPLPAPTEGSYFSKVLHPLVDLPSEYTWALTFENSRLCRPSAAGSGQQQQRRRRVMWAPRTRGKRML